jgi:hypothetical protein
MIFQTYEEKMTKLLMNINTFKTESPLEMTPTIINYTLKEYHDIIIKENVLVVNNPLFVFDLHTLKVVEYSISAKTNKASMFTASNLMTMKIDSLSLQDDDIDSDYVEYLNSALWNEDFIWFLYTAVKVNNRSIIRLAKIEKKVIQKLIDRLDAIDRINSKLSLNNDLKTIREYVKSKQFSIDKSDSCVNVEDVISEIIKNSIEEKEDSSKIKFSFVENSYDRLTAGLK